MAESKLDPSFPNSQFLIPGFHEPMRLDITSKRGGKLSYFLVIKNLILIKCLCSAIMKRSRLKNKAKKPCKAIDILNYKKQHNLVVKINNECMREYFDKSNVQKATKPF